MYLDYKYKGQSILFFPYAHRTLVIDPGLPPYSMVMGSIKFNRQRNGLYKQLTDLSINYTRSIEKTIRFI